MVGIGMCFYFVPSDCGRGARQKVQPIKNVAGRGTALCACGLCLCGGARPGARAVPADSFAMCASDT